MTNVPIIFKHQIDLNFQFIFMPQIISVYEGYKKPFDNLIALLRDNPALNFFIY